jgi:hypothetical protein
MKDAVVGLLAIGTGALFCYRGYIAMRLVIPLWGAFIGFFVGAGLVSAVADENFLADVTGWLVGLAVGLVFAAIAYLYYEVSVILGMAGIGFSIGTGLMVALGVRWSWLVVLAGVVVAIALAYFAIVAEMPLFLLVVLSATGGAVVVAAGAMLLTGAVDLDSFDAATTTERIDDDWWWYVLYVTLVVTGALSQLRDIGRLREGLRERWAESGGRQFRSV